ncbi:hypothetical protein BXU08_08405 [Sphingomonas sp. LM7]|nr:hypothetical protein BXU08_08405 [Sphingomonas sp. LM7]
MRKYAARFFNAASWFTAGAYVAAAYIEHYSPSLTDLRDARQFVGLVWIVCFVTLSALRPQNPSSVAEPSPAKSGTTVVLVTGLAAAAIVVTNDPTAASVTIAAGISGATLVLAWLVYRFASRNADQIGEARFDTMKPR